MRLVYHASFRSASRTPYSMLDCHYMNDVLLDPWGEYHFFHFSPNEIQTIKQNITKLLQQRDEVVFAYIYGSFLAAEQVRDIDVGVWVDGKQNPNKSWKYEVGLEDFLKKVLVTKAPIDIRVLNNAPFYFLNNVFRKGELLVSKDEKLLTDILEQNARDYLTEEYYYEQGHRLLLAGI